MLPLAWCALTPSVPMMWKLSAVLLRLVSLLMLLTALCGAGVWAQDLPLRWQRANSASEASAASIAALAKWHGKRVARSCDVLNYLGQRRRTPETDCCQGGQCISSFDDADVQGLMLRQFGLQARRLVRPLGGDEIARQIDARQPVLAHVASPDGARFVLITGISADNRVTLVDPLHGQLLFSLDELRGQHPGYEWRSTVLVGAGDDPARLLDGGGGVCRVERFRERYPERDWQWFEQNRTCYRFRCEAGDCVCTRWYQDNFWRSAPKWREHWVEREICQ